MSYRQVLQANTILDGKYRVDRVIGVGGFGITYEAFDVGLATGVAVKEYYPAQFGMRDATFTVRPLSEADRPLFDRLRLSFVREARTLARFDHPAIVRVLSVFEAHGTAYMVMKFESGPSLKSWLSTLGRFPTQDELDRITAPLLGALSILHGADFLHRDIAPDNIIIRDDGSAVLIDFGASRRVMGEASAALTGIVKKGFSPQEQYATDSKAQGPWTDIYALGATLYQAVTGQAPPEATERMLDDNVRPAVQVAAGRYRRAFLAAIDQAIRVRPAERPQSVRHWYGDLFAESQLAESFSQFVNGRRFSEPLDHLQRGPQGQQSTGDGRGYSQARPSQARASQPHGPSSANSAPRSVASGDRGARPGNQGIPFAPPPVPARSENRFRPAPFIAGGLLAGLAVLGVFVGPRLIGGSSPSGSVAIPVKVDARPSNADQLRLEALEKQRQEELARKAEQDRLAAAEQQRLRDEQARREAAVLKAEQDRLAAAEQQRLRDEQARREAAARKAEQDRIAAAEQQRLRDEQARREAAVLKAEQDRLAAAEQQRLRDEQARREAAARKAEQDRIAAAEQQRLRDEQARREAAARKAEQDRIAAAEQQRLRDEQARIAAEQQARAALSPPPPTTQQPVAVSLTVAERSDLIRTVQAEMKKKNCYAGPTNGDANAAEKGIGLVQKQDKQGTMPKIVLASATRNEFESLLDWMRQHEGAICPAIAAPKAAPPKSRPAAEQQASQPQQQQRQREPERESPPQRRVRESDSGSSGSGSSGRSNSGGSPRINLPAF